MEVQLCVLRRVREVHAGERDTDSHKPFDCLCCCHFGMHFLCFFVLRGLVVGRKGSGGVRWCVQYGIVTLGFLFLVGRDVK